MSSMEYIKDRVKGKRAIVALALVCALGVGGIAFSGGGEGGFVYGNTVDSEEAFLERFDRITTAIKKLPYVCGYCYTQVSDVQQENNGLLTAGHEYKIAPEKIREINLREAGPRKMGQALGAL